MQLKDRVISEYFVYAMPVVDWNIRSATSHNYIDQNVSKMRSIAFGVNGYSNHSIIRIYNFDDISLCFSVVTIHGRVIRQTESITAFDASKICFKQKPNLLFSVN